MNTDDLRSDGGSSPLSSLLSSPLSSARSSVAPESECFNPPTHSYPSPSASQRSSATTSPVPDLMTTAPPPCDADHPPPAKRRKISEPKPRTTERLTLQDGEVCDTEQPQLKRLVNLLENKRKIVVIAGAGISVSAGIPDFRSSTGLFKTLRKSQNLRSSGKDLFDASVYQDDQSTSSFHEMVRGLSTVTKTAQPTAFHHLLATLAEEGRLLRLYTQNVDGIDTSLKPLATEIPLPKKGPWPKTIQLHGGLEKMVCSKCHQLSDLEPGLFDGPIPPSCAKCEHTDSLRAISNMRSHGIGRLRPRMVLYNEHNPDDEAIGSVTHMDLKTRPDAVIVAGTTLKVPGVRRITREMCAVVRGRRDGMTVWINNDPEPIGKDLENCWDLIVRGPCDEVARHAAMRKWYEPKEEAKEVTDEQVAKAKANAPQVVIPSPKKSVIDIRQEQLVTPVASPRMAPQPSIETLQSSQDLPTPTKKRKITPTSKLAEMFDASTGSKPALKPAPKKRGPKLKNSIPGTTTKAVPKNPKTTAKATKPTKKATKSTKKVTTGKITNNFTVSKTAPKQTLKIKLSPQAETINVSPKKLVGTAIEMPTKTIPMAPLSPQAARNNASPPHNPPTPLQSPAVKHVNPVNPISTPKRITPTQARKGDTISPTGTLPHGLANFID